MNQPGPPVFSADEEWKRVNANARMFNAIHDDNPKLMQLEIAEGADPEATTSFHESALGTAARYGRVECLEGLIGAGASVNRCMADGTEVLGTALHSAIEAREFKSARTLLKHGADPAKVDSRGNTAGHLLVGPNAPFDSYEHEAIDSLAAMLDAGLPINQTNSNSQTMLMRAVRASIRTSVIELLLERGADPNVPDVMGMTPLHWLSDASAVHLFAAAGANVNAASANGRSPLSYCIHADQAQALLSLGADVNLRCKSGRSVISYMFEDGFNSTKSQLEDLIEVMLEAGADVDISHHSGRTAVDVLRARERLDKSRILALISASRARNALRSVSRKTQGRTAEA